jgi:hypothetical protein
MKKLNYYSLEKLEGGENPIIRVGYKNWYGKKTYKNLCKHKSIRGVWLYIENGLMFTDNGIINTFYSNIEDFKLI